MTHLEYQQLRNFGLTKPVRSPEFLRWVRQQGCITCGQPAEPHHFLGSTQSLKSGDLFVVPVCREHHRMLEDNPKMNYDLIVDWAKIIHRWAEEQLSKRIPLFAPPEIPDCCCARCGARFGAGSNHICKSQTNKGA